MQRQSPPRAPVHITLLDKFGVGSGGSGAAAGLVHPFAPTGKICWHGLEGFAATKQSVRAAQAAADALAATGVHIENVGQHDFDHQQLSGVPSSQSTIFRQQETDAANGSNTLSAYAASAQQYAVTRQRGILRIGSDAKQTWRLINHMREAQAEGQDVCNSAVISAKEAHAVAPGLSEQRLQQAVTWLAARSKRAKEWQREEELLKLGVHFHNIYLVGTC